MKRTVVLAVLGVFVTRARLRSVNPARAQVRRERVERAADEDPSRVSRRRARRTAAIGRRMMLPTGRRVGTFRTTGVSGCEEIVAYARVITERAAAHGAFMIL